MNPYSQCVFWRHRGAVHCPEPRLDDAACQQAQELAAVEEQLTDELRSLAQSTLALQKVAGEFGNAGIACEQLSEQKEGKSESPSVYCRGAIDSNI